MDGAGPLDVGLNDLAPTGVEADGVGPNDLDTARTNAFALSRDASDAEFFFADRVPRLPCWHPLRVVWMHQFDAVRDAARRGPTVLRR